MRRQERIGFPILARLGAFFHKLRRGFLDAVAPIDGGHAPGEIGSGDIRAGLISVLDLYASFSVNNIVSKIYTAGNLTVIAGTGNPAGPLGDNGPAIQASLSSPSGVEVDGAGNVYITDSGNARIRKIDASGKISTIDSTPRGLTVIAADPQGNLYFAIGGTPQIQKTSTSGTLTTVAGTEVYGFAGDGGPAIQAQMSDPSGLAVDTLAIFSSRT